MAEQLTNNKSVLCRYVDTLGVVHEGWFRLDELAAFFANPLGTTALSDIARYVGTYDSEVGDEDLSEDVKQLKADVQASSNGLLDRTTTLETAINKAIDGAVVAAVAANQTLTLNGNVIATDAVAIGTTTYTFVDALTTEPKAVPYEVLKGATASDTLDNLIAAINGAAGAGTTYGTDTVAHTIVTAAAGDLDTMKVTAKVKGAAYNTTPTANPVDSSGAMAWGDKTLKNGVDGTVGGKGTLRFEATKLWVAVADCTVSDSTGWKYITFTG